MLCRNGGYLVLAVAVIAFLFSGCKTACREQPIQASPEKMHEKTSEKRLLTFAYIEERAHQSNIAYRHLKTYAPREKVQSKGGCTDKTTRISPSGKRGAGSFHRQNIAKFIYLLEGRASGMNREPGAQPRVTVLSLDRPSEDREKWAMSLSLTERYPRGNTGREIPPLPSAFVTWHKLFCAIESCRKEIDFLALDRITIDAASSTPIVKMDGEIGSGKAMDLLIAALEDSEHFSLVIPGVFYPSEKNTFRFSGMKITLADPPATKTTEPDSENIIEFAALWKTNIGGAVSTRSRLPQSGQ
jgi:hypothetical protein